MKKKLIKLLLGLLILSTGWIAGYLKIPYFDSSYNFWVGFVACILLFGIGYVFYKIRSSNRKLTNQLERTTFNKDSDQSDAFRHFKSTQVFTSVLIFTGCLLVSIIIYKQSDLFKERTKKLEFQISELQEVSDALTKKHKVDLMANVLNLVDDELRLNPDGPISSSTIARIAAYSSSLKPYKYFIDDSLSDKLLSPERGQLLTALTLMNIDSLSFKRIKSSVDFSYSDLRHCNFRGKDLSGINLSSADLSHADLTQINLDSSMLRKATLTAAILNKASISNANLRSANMQWVQMQEGIMIHTDASGADMSYGQFQNSDLSESHFYLVCSKHTTFKNAILRSLNCESADLKGSNFSNTDFKHGVLKLSELEGSSFRNVELDSVEVELDWMNKVEKLNITGLDTLNKIYVSIPFKIDGLPAKYYLIKK